MPLVVRVQDLERQRHICAKELVILLHIVVSHVDLLDQVGVVRKVMEQSGSINDKVALSQRASLLDELWLLPKNVNVLPKHDVHSAQRIIEAAGPLHS